MTFANRMIVNSANTSGKNFIPSLPVELRNMLAKKLVGYFGHQPEPARNEHPICRRPDQQQRNHKHDKPHKQCGIGKAISCPPIMPMTKKFLISNWWIGSILAPIVNLASMSSFHAPISSFLRRFLT